MGDTLAVNADSSLTLARGSGRCDSFAPSASGSGYFALTSTNDTLARAADGSFTVTSPAGTSRSFSAAGRLLSISDNGMLRVSLTYDSAGHLATARAHNRSLKFTYNDAQRISSVSDDAGRTVGYTYDGGGNLTGQRNADGSSVTYQYDSNGVLTGFTTPAGTYTILYNSDPPYLNVTSVQTPDGAARSYDMPRSPREIRVTDGAGVSTLYSSDATGLLQSVTDALGNRTTFTYDATGRRTAMTNAAGETTRYAYDNTGRPAALTDGAGNRWTADYDSNGRLYHVIDTGGNGWAWGYDGVGNTTVVVSPTGQPGQVARNSAGTITSLDFFGVAADYEYDADGLVTKSTSGTGDATTWRYDAAGRATSRTDSAGTINAQYANAAAPVSYTSGDARAAHDESGITRDALGRVTAYTDSFGNQLSYTWDAAGRLKSLGIAGKTITYQYDGAGRLSQVSDWGGNFALYRYDAAGYPVSVNASGGPVTVYQYDGARNLKAILSTGPDGAPVAGYRYTLDGNANRTAISALNASTKAFQLTGGNFGFDAAHRPVSRDGQAFRYDGRGNLTAISGGPNVNFGYDAFGRLQTLSGDQSATYAYDSLGLRVTRTLNGDTRRFVYDISGAAPRVVMETDSAGKPLAYYVWGLVPLWKVSAAGQPYFYHYDGDGNVVAVSNPTAGVVNRYRYDPQGRLLMLEETVDNSLHASGATGAIDDGNGLVYTGSGYFHSDLRLTLPSTIDITPPVPNLTPPMPPPGLCLLFGPADCALLSARRPQ